MSGQIGQLFPPSAKFTEKEVPDQTGKVRHLSLTYIKTLCHRRLTRKPSILTALQVFLVTGGAAGLGFELVKILYNSNAKVYIAARSEEKASKAIASIMKIFPESSGEMVFHHLDLNDLTLVKQSADSFLAKENRLDVLWNNAGVMAPPQG